MHLLIMRIKIIIIFIIFINWNRITHIFKAFNLNLKFENLITRAKTIKNVQSKQISR